MGKNITSLHVEHVVPVQPLWHWQKKPPRVVLKHVAPFWHGVDEQAFETFGFFIKQFLNKNKSYKQIIDNYDLLIEHVVPEKLSAHWQVYPPVVVL